MTIAIVAHPDRKEWVSLLADITRPEVICWDTDGRGCERNHLAAWHWLAESTAADPNAHWGVVLEDDTRVVPDFLHQLRQVLHFAPTPIVSLYLGRGHPHGGTTDWQNRIAAKIAAPVSFLTADALLSAQGYAIAAPLIPEMIASITPRVKPHRKATIPTPIDEAISQWAARRPQPLLISHSRPSIVDHRDEAPLITTRKDGQPRTLPRTAWLFDSREEWDSTAEYLAPVRKSRRRGR